MCPVYEYACACDTDYEHVIGEYREMEDRDELPERPCEVCGEVKWRRILSAPGNRWRFMD